jgi:hypothetical protein
MISVRYCGNTGVGVEEGDDDTTNISSTPIKGEYEEVKYSPTLFFVEVASSFLL